MEERKRIYSETRQDLLNRQLSNSQNYDRAILSLSTTILGLSTVFIKDIVVLSKSNNIWMLYFSWVLFGLAVASTVISFLSSQHGISIQLKFAEKYYLEEKEEYLNKKNFPAALTEVLNYLSASCFLIAMGFMITFIGTNINGGAT